MDILYDLQELGNTHFKNPSYPKQHIHDFLSNQVEYIIHNLHSNKSIDRFLHSDLAFGGLGHVIEYSARDYRNIEKIWFVWLYHKQHGVDIDQRTNNGQTGEGPVFLSKNKGAIKILGNVVTAVLHMACMFRGNNFMEGRLVSVTFLCYHFINTETFNQVVPNLPHDTDKW